MAAPDLSRRADVFLVEQGYAATRAEAQAAIAAGGVLADGQRILKPSQTLHSGAAVSYRKAHPFVSRGALKLAAALDHFALSPEGRVCLDIGASTGGFTEVLLLRGASQVFAVDVGHGQLNPRIARDPRVVNLEGFNARALTAEHVPAKPTAIVVDVSFIGLKLVLPPAMALAGSNAFVVALIKPQFEVGRDSIGRGGIVRDDTARLQAVEDILAWLKGLPDWTVLGYMDSPISGGDGNREFLVAAQKS